MGPFPIDSGLSRRLPGLKEGDLKPKNDEKGSNKYRKFKIDRDPRESIGDRLIFFSGRNMGSVDLRVPYF